MKKASIAWGLLLVPMITISSYNACTVEVEVDKAEKSDNIKKNKFEKSYNKKNKNSKKDESSDSKKNKKTSKKESSNNEKSDNRKKTKTNKNASVDSEKLSESKKSNTASKDEINTVKKMYSDFQKLLNNPTSGKIREFYDKYFVTNIHKSFGINKVQKEAFDNALIDYCVKFLKSDISKQAKGYKMSDNLSKINKQKTKIIKCKLQKNDDTIDMSVYLDKNNKIKDFSIMKTFQLIKGARNIVENYCKENKQQKYKQFKKDEKLNICIEAWKANK